VGSVVKSGGYNGDDFGATVCYDGDMERISNATPPERRPGVDEVDSAEVGNLDEQDRQVLRDTLAVVLRSGGTVELKKE
jgi:hypothetical protein